MSHSKQLHRVMKNTKIKTGIQRVIDIVGTQTALAIKLKVKPQTVSFWVARGIVPGKKCRAIEKLVGGAVSRRELNKDVFGD